MYIYNQKKIKPTFILITVSINLIIIKTTTLENDYLEKFIKDIIQEILLLKKSYVLF